MSSLNIYDFTVPQQIRMLKNLDAILTKATETASSKNLDPTAFPSARLHPDMLPLSFQIKIACDTAYKTANLIGGSSATLSTDPLETMEDLHARIAQTIEILEGVKHEDYDGKETGRHVLFGGKLDMSGTEFAVKFITPNFYFHVTAAYAILRSLGIDVGKMDYLGGF